MHHLLGKNHFFYLDPNVCTQKKLGFGFGYWVGYFTQTQTAPKTQTFLYPNPRPKNVYIKKSSLAKPAKMMSFRLRQNLAEIRVNKMRTFDLNAFLLLRIGPLHRPTKCFELLFPYPIVLVIE